MNLLCGLFLILVTCAVGLNASNARKGRITGGREAEPHSNPYVVSLQIKFLWLRYRLCTGSILSERWILSAGHCVTDSWARWLYMDAIVGAHNIEYIRTSQIYPISHRIAHPKYRGGVGPYDIAMMRTSRNIEFSQEVQPLNLPLVPTRDETTPENLLITGWGALQSTFFVTVLPTKLQEAEVTYLPYYDCYRAVDRIKDFYEPNPLRKIHNLCTGPISGGIAGCTGDSGGPLVQYVPVMVSEAVPTESISVIEDTTITSESTEPPGQMTTERTSTTSGSTSSPTQITTDRTSTTSGSISSPMQMTTDRTSTTSGSTSSPTQITTDRTSTTSGSTSSPMQMTTDRTSTTSGSTSSPTQITTDRTSTATSGTTASPTPVNTDRTSTTAAVSPTQISTDRTSTTTISPTTEETTTFSTVDEITTDVAFDVAIRKGLSIGKRLLRVDMIPTVIGVISWGVVPCGKKGAPTVYSNVTNYMDFINKYLLSNTIYLMRFIMYYLFHNN